jgi:hypothetical protein
MATKKTLNQNQLRRLSDLLDIAIGNKDHQHPSDARRAAVLFYSINNLGYQFVDTHVYDIIDNNSRFSYSNSMKKYLGGIANVCNDLVEGLSNSENSMFNITTEEKLQQ